ncbi:MAG TPA: amidohydrolase family protein [Thermoanaerobaculia bacterium]|nr:amidohydrolase family protein [Thermoanaerobaculia bacterium]
MSARGALAAVVVLALAAGPGALAETLAIVGGTVHTVGPQGTIEGGTVVVRDGKIAAVGRDVAVPAGARTIDARGKVVTPGLFDSLTRLGVVEVDQVETTRDFAVEDDEITAALTVAEAINPRSMLIPVNRVEGLTRAMVAPSPGASLIAGQGAIIHLGGGTDLVVRAQAAMFAALGEEGMSHAGGARGAALLRLREALQDAADYAANRPAFERGARRPYALSRLDLEALVPVVRGELPLVLSVDRASDIRAALALGREHSLRLILAGVTEGWTVAEEIAAAKVPVLVNPMVNLPARFEALAATLENAARLAKAGVTVAFATGDAHNARNIKQGAGNAVSYGMTWEDALRAMTLTPARIWGLADRLGSLEVGKEADVVVWDGDPLELATFPTQVVIRGVEVPMDSRQTRLRDRYRTLPGELPPAYRQP